MVTKASFCLLGGGAVKGKIGKGEAEDEHPSP